MHRHETGRKSNDPKVREAIATEEDKNKASRRISAHKDKGPSPMATLKRAQQATRGTDYRNLQVQSVWAQGVASCVLLLGTYHRKQSSSPSPEKKVCKIKR